jgi:hypothetical protein
VTGTIPGAAGAATLHFLVGVQHDGRARSWAVVVQSTAPMGAPSSPEWRDAHDRALADARAKAEAMGDPIPRHSFITVEHVEP